MLKPDTYYGDDATWYDASREVKPKWKAELAAVSKFVGSGPVLDVPLGTGRFVPIYREKELRFVGVDISGDMLAIARTKFGEIDARRGSAFDLPFSAGEFGTVVCIRFLEWLDLPKAAMLIRRLLVLAPALIVSINHGDEGHPDAYTYDFGKFLRALDGIFIAGRHVTAQIPGITSEVFNLRAAGWSDVQDQFRFDGLDPDAEIQRIADKHAAFFDLPARPVNEGTAKVRAEYWDGAALGAVVQSLAEHRFLTDAPPRRTHGPLTLLKHDGRTLMIDGRHRANMLMAEPGPHPVLVLEC